MAHTDPHDPATPAGLGHETRDVDLTGAYRFLLVMVVFLVLTFAFVYFVFTKWRGEVAAGRPQPSPVAVRDGDRLPPLPRLQTTPNADLKAFTAAEDEVLTTYAWVDKEKGVVRLPIAKAIELVAQRGLPSAGPSPAETAAPAPVAATPTP